MSERVTAVLTEHQRQGSNACLCGWSKLGHSFPAHQAEMVTAALFSEEAIERAAEALWMHRPMERIAGGEPKPFRGLKPYQRLRYLGMARAVVAALRGEA